MTSGVVRRAVASCRRKAHNSQMARERTKADRKRTFLKEWRKHRGLSLDKAIERLELEAEYPFSKGQLSRVERSEFPYSQDLLEALALIYRCDVPDLIMRDPTAPDAIWSIWDQLQPTQRAQLVEIGQTLKKAG